VRQLLAGEVVARLAPGHKAELPRRDLCQFVLSHGRQFKPSGATRPDPFKVLLAIDPAMTRIGASRKRRAAPTMDQ
jgi:hypothetical protein